MNKVKQNKYACSLFWQTLEKGADPTKFDAPTNKMFKSCDLSYIVMLINK